MDIAPTGRQDAAPQFDPAVLEALGEFLHRPSARIAPEAGDALLDLLPERPTEDELALLAPAIDRYVFDCALGSLKSVSDAEWLAALAPDRTMRIVAGIALASADVLEGFALCTAAAALHVPISRHVTKAAADRIRRILSPEAAELAFGEAQFFYPELATLCDAEAVHAEIFAREDAAARDGIAGFGAAVVEDLVSGASPVWGGLIRFRNPMRRAAPPAFTLRDDHRELLLRIWERKWPNRQNF